MARMDATSPPDAGDVFQAIADPTRRAILQLVAAEERPANALAERFASQMSRPAVSQHLRILRAAGLVTERRVGRERRYRLRAAPLREVRDWVRQYEWFWRDHFDRLADYLEGEP
jgi:DNA-binding transcriptional ArsR family regulator